MSANNFFRGQTGPAPDVPEIELEEAPRDSAKPVLSVTFVDGAGTPYQFAYSHLYRVAVENRALVVEFSEHAVTVEGRGLSEPLKDCLMRKLGHHKAEFVVVDPRAEFTAGPCVTAIKVAKRG